MRLRATVPAVTTALLLTLAGSAAAAQGDFLYRSDDSNHTLADPRGGDCVRLPLPDPSSPAHHVDNQTDSTAVVYLDDDCASDTYYVLPPHTKAPARVLVRSVVFAN
ncbi:hypothetical protein HUO13_08035 [Saccharopolyspora erythraea]|uniref:hypothetical protein n=1 Tax=Saccharopolyspora erythraea TaxID=1836 RepID=UPI001BA4A679|nr:hypothetical protein [Saccharopolyspora erythraea]QUH00769.1 hypothetical protein HUO13_08035 [Saccharopolyspora erythraea]